MNDLDLPAAAVTAATTAAAAAAATGALLRLGDVYLDGTAVELGPVERRKGLVGRFVLVKGDEAESPRTTRVAIADHDGLGDLAMGTEGPVQAVVVRIPA